MHAADNAAHGPATETESPTLRAVRAELFATVFVTGGCVILIEIVGTRVIGPVFGVSLFVWSALLAVTLGSLACGYYVGGVLVDRAPRRRLLGLVVVIAGVLLAVVPLLIRVVLGSTVALGPRGGSLVAAAVLFAPSLIALGTIGPIAVRLATREVRSAGHGVGSVYAISTGGSLIGTFVTAFLLVPAFDTSVILLGTATVLTLVGAISLAWHGRRAALAAVTFPLLVAASSPAAALPSGIQVLDRAQSLYGLVEVIEDQNRQVRLLRSDHSILGAQIILDRTSGFDFTHLLESVRYLRPAAKEMLQIGLGTGALALALEPADMQIDVVEIDPAVVRFARRYFGFTTRGQVYEEDARTFLSRTSNRYDLVVHDTFTGGTTPEHLLSIEVLQQIHNLLRPGGVLVLNFAGYQRGPKAEAAWAVARTLHAVFRNVRAFRDSPPDDAPNDAGNIIFFAADSLLDFAIPAELTAENAACKRVLRSFRDWEVLQLVPDGPLVTDSRNPLARMQLPVAEEHFAAMNQMLPLDVWLY
jgi:SAM-dependent methyltransferase